MANHSDLNNDPNDFATSLLCYYFARCCQRSSWEIRCKYERAVGTVYNLRSRWDLCFSFSFSSFPFRVLVFSPVFLPSELLVVWGIELNLKFKIRWITEFPKVIVCLTPATHYEDQRAQCSLLHFSVVQKSFYKPSPSLLIPALIKGHTIWLRNLTVV